MRKGFLLITLFLSACGHATTDRLLPWFKIKSTHYDSIGGLADAHTNSESFVRSYGIWRKLDKCWGGTVLNPETVVLTCSTSFNSGLAVLKRGETVPRPACGSYAVEGLVTPGKDAIDCIEMLAGRAPIVPTRLGVRRVSLEGKTLTSATIAVEEAGRAFLGPIPRFYDQAGTPYFVVSSDKGVGKPDCALWVLRDGALKPVPATPEDESTDCYDPAEWSARAGLTLTDSLGRPAKPKSRVPTSPQKLHIVVH